MQRLRSTWFILTIICSLSLPSIAWFDGDLEAAKQLLAKEARKEAQPILEKALKAGGENVEVLSMLCDAYNTEEGYEKALEYGAKAVKLGPENGQAHFRMAQAYASKLQFGNMFAGYAAAKELRAHIRKAVELSPENLDAALFEIQFYENAVGPLGGDKDHAKELVQALAKHHPEEAYHLQGQEAISANDGKAALALYDKVVEANPKSAKGHFWRSRALRMLDRVDDGVKALKLIEKDWDETYYYMAAYQLGRLKLVEDKDYDAAIGYFKDFLDHAPEGTQPGKSATAWRLGTCYEAKKDWKAAVAAYKQAMTYEPVYDKVADSLKKAMKKAR